MKKTNKYITAAALCSTIMIGGLQVPSISYAASNQSIVAPSTEAKLLEDFKRELKQKINNQEENITLKYNTKESDARSVMNMLYQEYNKIVDADEYIKYNIASTRYSIRGLPGNYTFTLHISYRESKEQTQYVKAQAKAIVNTIIKAGMDEHEKVKAIHDYVVKHVSYDTSYQAYTAYEALANRSAVCQGYTLLTYQLMQQAGIQTRFVTGKGNGQAHAWNLVKIEGKWYHLDTTFDDPVPDKAGRVTYSYYNMTDEQMSKDHEWDRSKYPAATTNYYDELINKIKAGSAKTAVYNQMLKDTNLVYLSTQYGANNYNELKQKLQKEFAAKPQKVELRYKQSMDGTMQDINRALNEISWPKGAKHVSYQVAPYSAMAGYSLATITFTY
ncbi:MULTISPECIES: transglutaminase domain-containing protein [Bacillus cereus group]|uniref:Transglutaminase domain protein n=1 Tax=Bacillus cytotoxicus TaxID=580165 RepID=A0AAX2CFT2_9BACI|nr:MULTISPECIES: transglutaminase domain-containing protein [Bacillus cereus group]QTR77702.1 peptidase [Bacillus cytotoxicus]QTR82478.1 peptidase [Bacillus cytotoxicus]QTR86216.1 peptidase [Bacillus cytotoxicus]SCL90179.1 Transglutaminase domain protein [Bacillus cytotoxicus]HDR4571542.1 peptidase [Bacillus cytotoxicus]